MSLRTAFRGAACGTAFILSVTFALPALAQNATATAQDRMKACSAEWNAAKAAGKVAAGETWQTFFKACNARLQAAAGPSSGTPAGASAPATTPSVPTTAPAATQARATAQERMKTCSAEWNAAKAAGKVAPGENWQSYFRACNARLQAGTPAAPAAAPGASPAPAVAASTPQSRMKQCGDEWQKLKASGKVPQGQTWQKYYADCSARLSAAPAPAAPTAAPQPAAPAAAQPATAPAPAQAAKPASPAAPATPPAAVPPGSTAKPTPAPAAAAAKPDDDEDTGEGVREPTPGQLAARERMKECGAQWRTAKDAGKIPEGQTWPQYWSACNKRLKAAGK